MNFKGFGEKTFEVAFEPKGQGSLLLLGGPNGYGKTTLFDALEIALRGTLRRAKKFDKVEQDTGDFSKMPFQNKFGKDVIIKLWISDSLSNKDHIIIRRYPGNSEGRLGSQRKHKTMSFFDLLESYYSNVPEFYDAPDWSQKDDGSKINETLKSLLYEKKIDPRSGYLLLNYVQQQDNIYYLSKGEREKRDDLAFLFQTEPQEKLAEKLKNVDQELFKSLIDTLDLEIETLKANDVRDVEGGDVRYHQLFPDKDIAFDNENPFDGLPSKELKAKSGQFRVMIDQLTTFLEKFDLSEFRKDQSKKKLVEFSGNQQQIDAVIARQVLSEENISILKKNDKQEKDYQRYSQLMQEIVSGDLTEYEDRAMGVLKGLNYTEDSLAEFVQKIAKLRAIGKAISTNESLLSDLKRSKEKFRTDFEALHQTHPQDPNCPFCGTLFPSLKALFDAVDRQTVKISEELGSQGEARNRMSQEIEEQYIKPTSDRIKQFLDSPATKRLKEIWKHLRPLEGFKSLLDSKLEILRQHEIDIDEFEFKIEYTWDQFEGLRNRFSEVLDAVIESISIDQALIENSTFFKSYFEEEEERMHALSVKDLESKQRYLDRNLRQKSDSKLQLLKARRRKILELRNFAGKELVAPIMGAVKKYKNDTVRMLQIPMYIYSAKILQNCPQGDGIFLDMKPNTNAVKFLVDNYSAKNEQSNHSIIHHLSSGQLAVVSIAFCLALNRLSGSPFRFIAIDDPLQTLDDLNIHSLIEVMRHDFKDYQLLFSTHEDDAAKYMYYRFSKADFDVQYIDMKEKYLELG